MTKRHTIAYYNDGNVNVAYCKICSAEGLKLLEDCPQKFEVTNKKFLDDKEQTVK